MPENNYIKCESGSLVEHVLMLNPMLVTEKMGGPGLPNWTGVLEWPLGLSECDW